MATVDLTGLKAKVVNGLISDHEDGHRIKEQALIKLGKNRQLLKELDHLTDLTGKAFIQRTFKCDGKKYIAQLETDALFGLAYLTIKPVERLDYPKGYGYATYMRKSFFAPIYDSDDC